MPLADTPSTWPNGPSLSTLHVLLLFVGIPLLVIVVVSLLVLAPGWVNGPRYRPGQPWDAKSEWFGPALAGGSPDQDDAAHEPASVDASGGQSGSQARPASAAASAGQTRQGTGGASAGW